jgi:hypothetical protein
LAATDFSGMVTPSETRPFNGQAMDKNLRYVISANNSDEFPMDRADFRAYFYWKENDSELERSFSIDELEAHIAECKAKGAPTEMLEAALKRLRQINNSMV